MQYAHTASEAQQIAEKASLRVKKAGLPLVPFMFELWYAYYSKSRPDIIKAVDGALAVGDELTFELCVDLYDRYLSQTRQAEFVRQAGDSLNRTLTDVSGMVEGAKNATSDYGTSLSQITGKLSKTKDPNELANVLNHVISDTDRMINQNKVLEDQLDKTVKETLRLKRDLEEVQKEALTDGLTGLSNRKSFDRDIRRTAGEAMDEGQPFSLLMMDIDHFKSFNDNYGHPVGDQVLRLVARTLIDGVKGRDVAARYGGEEFAIILPNTRLPSGVSVANTLRKTVAGKDVINRNTNQALGRITLSVGVAEYMIGEPVEDLIERADAALYTAKQNGRNQVAAAPTPKEN